MRDDEQDQTSSAVIHTQHNTGRLCFNNKKVYTQQKEQN